MFIAKNNDLIVELADTQEELENKLKFMLYTSIEETDKVYQKYIPTGEILTLDEINAKEQERIAKLHLTRGDVFRALLQAKGVTRDMLRAEILKMPESVQREIALIDFDEALDFYRGNSLIDTIGATLDIDKDQLDRFFQSNDYHDLIKG